MTRVFIQLVLLLFAGVGLWVICRVFIRQEPVVRRLVLAGFAARAILGALLFWIAWLRLPIARSLQLEHGIWFFAADGRHYFLTAAQTAEAGARAILSFPRNGISASYVQALSALTYLFGSIASVAVLLNVFCYLGMSLIVLKWLKSSPASRLPGLLALAAITLSPSAVLWSAAPLKDTLFQFLIVCAIGAGALWQRGWRDRPAVNAILLSAAVMAIALFGVTGMRWYFGFAQLCASAVFLILTAATSRKKALAALSGMVLLFLLSQMFVRSASSYAPSYVQYALAPWSVRAEPQEMLSIARLARDIRGARRGFEDSGGATSIGIGGPLAKIDGGRTMVPEAAPVTDDDWAQMTTTVHEASVERRSEPAPAQASVVATATPEPATTEVAARDIAEPEVASRETSQATTTLNTTTQATTTQATTTQATTTPEATNPEVARRDVAANITPTTVAAAIPLPAAPDPQTDATSARPHASNVPPVAPATVAPKPATSTTTAPEIAAHAVLPVTPPATSTAETKSPVEQREASAAAVPVQPRPVTSSQKRAQKVANRTRRARPILQPAPAAQPLPVPVANVAPPPAAAPASAVPASPPVPAKREAIVVPASTAGRLVAGGLAVLVPSFITRKLGILTMGGGRGLWWFTDLDTIVFDLVVLFAIGFTVHRLRWATLRNPIFWFVLLVAGIGLPLVYTVTNYGTLFRLRIMMYVALALVPLALSMAAADARIDPPRDEV